MEGCAGFVVHDVQRGLSACGGESCKDVGVGRNAMCVAFGGEGADQDGVGVRVEGDHDVLVAAARARCEAARVVREEA